MRAVRLPERLPGMRRLRLPQERFESAQCQQGVAAQRGIGSRVKIERLFELAEHLAGDGETAAATEAGPERRLAPVAARKEAQEEIAFKSRREESMFRIVEPAQRAVGFGPEARVAIGM